MKTFIKPDKISETWLPVYNTDKVILSKKDPNKIYACDIWEARNIKHHKLIFALANCVLNNLPDDHFYKNYSAYDFIKLLMIEIGQFKEILRRDGQLILIPNSLKFECMSEEEFQPISDAVFKICAGILKITVEELRKNYIEYLE
jgi:hypothetical protein